MANVSIPKVLWGLIYLALPAFLILSPEVVTPYIPEEMQSWAIPAVIGLIALIGLCFIASQHKKLITAITFILIIAAVALAVYLNWDKVTTRFDLVSSHYKAGQGEYYDNSSTEFQAKIGQIVPLLQENLLEIVKFIWIAIAIPTLILGLMGIKGVIEFAAIPKSHTKNVYNDKDIPENLQAQTNRPTAEQRAAKLEAIKSSTTSSKPATAFKAATPDEEPAPAVQAFQATTTPSNGVIMPAWESGGNAAEPIIKANNTPAPEVAPASPFAIPNAAPAPQPVPTPVVAVAPTPVVAPEPVAQAPIQPAVAPAPAPVVVQPEIAPAPIPVAPVAPVYSEPATPAYTEPAQPAANPFENMNNPFGQFSTPAPEPVAEKPILPEPEPEPELVKVNPFANMASPFTQPAPEPVQPEAPKVVLQPTIMPTATVTPAQTKVTPKVAPKEQISDDEKNRIKELQQEVSELKTLYNQGMITQDEYITQRTALLQQMYSKKN